MKPSLLYRILVPGKALCWYSRMPPADLTECLWRSTQPRSAPPFSWKQFLFPVHNTEYRLMLHSDAFKLHVRCKRDDGRGGYSELDLAGTIAAYEDGSIMQGWISPNPVVKFISLTVLPFAIVLALYAGVRELLAVPGTEDDFFNALGFILFPFLGTRLSFRLNKDHLYTEVRRQFLAQELTLPGK